jgi:TolB-like protein
MSAEPIRAVFLSYASEDAEAARRIVETLRSGGVEVWFDQSELVGGDVWDTKIRGQIASCALFLPIISANTQARLEGYFRLEWKIAAQRTHTMAEEKSFLLPVVIDTTRDADAKVPAEFRAVQWTKLPAGETSPAFVNRVNKLLGALSNQTAAAASARPQPSTTPVAKSGRVLWVATAAGALLLGFIAFIALRPSAKETPISAPANSTVETKTAPAALAPGRSVAVLAFTNMSADRDTEHFSDGVSEELRNVLANIPELKVAARTSAFFYKGKQVSIKQVAQELGVAYVVEGSVRRSGDRLRITAQLIKANDGFQLWSQNFEAEMKDIFAVQDEIAGLVAKNLSVKLSTATLAALPTASGQTQNLAAYDAYQRARAMQISGRRGPSAKETVRLYEEAVRVDPRYALAWARLAQTLVQQGGTSGAYDNSPQTKDMARNAATTALSLAPDLPEAHVSMAEVRLSIDFSLEEARLEIAEAERLRPSDSETPVLRVRLEWASGRWGESLVNLIAGAVESDPQNAASLTFLGRTLTEVGRFADAERLLERSWMLSRAWSATLRGLAENTVTWTGDVRRVLEILDLMPENLRSTTLLYYPDRGEMRTWLGDFSGAIADYEQTRSLSTRSDFQTSGPRTIRVTVTNRLAKLAAKAGKSDRAAQLHAEALAGARQLVKDYPELHPSFSALALVLAAHGDKAGALMAIDEMVRLATRTQDTAEIAKMRQDKAEVLAVLGDTSAAITELRAVHTMGRAYGYRLRLNPEWESLRDDLRFQQLMKEAEAQADAQPRPTRRQLR